MDLKSLERTGSEKARYVLLLSDNCSKDFLFTNRTKGRENISIFLMFGCWANYQFKRLADTANIKRVF